MPSATAASAPSEVVADVEAYLRAPRAQHAFDVKAVATAYAELCEEANARLRLCRTAIHAGNPAVALQTAEHPTDLIERAALLTRVPAAAWRAETERLGIAPAPPVLEDAVELLQAAYNDALARGPLLQLFHRQNLVRYPLRKRLRTVWAIAAKEDGHGWQDDVKAFEAARLDELRNTHAAPGEIEVARAAGDLAALVAIEGELKLRTWRTPAPPTIVSELHAALKEVRAKRGLGELSALIPGIVEAHGERKDVDACRRLLDRWDSIVADTGAEASASMVAAIEPAATWLAREREIIEVERRRADATLALRTAMADPKTTSHQLSSLHRALDELGGALEPANQDEYDRARGNRELEESRRRRMIALAFTGTVVAAALAVVLLIQARIERGRVANLGHQIVAAASAGDLPEARRLYDALAIAEPRTLPEPPIVEAKETLESAERAERERREQFVRAVGRAEAKGPGDPDSFSIDEASRLARTSEERAWLIDFRAKIEDAKVARQRKVDEAFGAKLASINDAIVGIEDDPDRTSEDPATLRGFGPKLEATARIVEDCRAELARGPSADFAPSIDLAAKRIARVAEVYQKTLQRMDLLDEMARAAGKLSESCESVNDYVAALTAFGKQFPDSARAEELHRALNREAGWRAVDGWAEMAPSIAESFSPRSARQADDRLAAVRAYVTRFPGSPFAAPLDDYRGYLERARVALGDGQKRRDKLRDFLNRKVFSLFSVRSKGKNGGTELYYVLDRSDVEVMSDGTVVAKVLLSTADFDRKSPISFGAGACKGLESSPQCELREAVRRRLGSAGIDQWETFWLDVAQVALTECPDVDPVVRAILLSEVLPSAIDCGWRVDKEIADMREKLPRPSDPPINFTDPDDPVAGAARDTLRRAIAGFPAIADLKARVVAQRAALARSLLLRCVGHAVLLREGGAWTVAAPRGVLNADGRRVLAVAGDPGASFSLRQIGVTKGGRATPADADVAGVPEGSLLFVVEADN